MKKQLSQKIAWGQLFILISLVSLLFINPNGQTKAQDSRFVSEQIMQVSAKPIDPRARILQDYLEQYNSPLAGHSQDFIDAADMYKVDWRLVPSIAGVESTFGKFIPGGYEPGSISYNAWGWGVYGDQALGFKSWKDGIYTLNKGLRENYINRGYTEPYSMNKIYASSPTWGGKVSYFMQDMEKFSRNHVSNQLSMAKLEPETDPKIAGQSASLITQ